MTKKELEEFNKPPRLLIIIVKVLYCVVLIPKLLIEKIINYDKRTNKKLGR